MSSPRSCATQGRTSRGFGFGVASCIARDTIWRSALNVQHSVRRCATYHRRAAFSIASLRSMWWGLRLGGAMRRPFHCDTAARLPGVLICVPVEKGTRPCTDRSPSVCAGCVDVERGAFCDLGELDACETCGVVSLAKLLRRGWEDLPPRSESGDPGERRRRRWRSVAWVRLRTCARYGWRGRKRAKGTTPSRLEYTAT